MFNLVKDLIASIKEVVLVNAYQYGKDCLLLLVRSLDYAKMEQFTVAKEANIDRKLKKVIQDKDILKRFIYSEGKGLFTGKTEDFETRQINEWKRYRFLDYERIVEEYLKEYHPEYVKLYQKKDWISKILFSCYFPDIKQDLLNLVDRKTIGYPQQVIIIPKAISKQLITATFAIAFSQKGLMKRQEVIPYLEECFPYIKDKSLFFYVIDHLTGVINPAGIPRYIKEISKQKCLSEISFDDKKAIRSIPDNDNQKPRLTEVAKKLGISRTTLWLYQKQGKLICKKDGRLKVPEENNINKETLISLKIKKENAKKVKEIINAYAEKKGISFLSAKRWFYMQKAKGYSITDIEQLVTNI